MPPFGAVSRGAIRPSDARGMGDARFKRFHKVRAHQFLQRLATEGVDLFVHWQIGMTGVFARWEPSEVRASRSILRVAGGETPPDYSTDQT